MRNKQLLTIFSAVLLMSTLLLTSAVSFAQQPVVGRKAASKYFERSPDQDIQEQNVDESSGGTARPASRGSFGDGMLMLSLGSYLNSTAFDWKGDGKRENVGKLNYGVTYFVRGWEKLDMNLRMDFSEFKLDEMSATKLSVMPLWTFPAVDRRFPLYFGFGVGMGVFFRQVPDESNISFDYQLVAGARFMDLFENAGFFAEIAMKNHLHILTNGQFNGTSLTAGAVFSF